MVSRISTLPVEPPVEQTHIDAWLGQRVAPFKRPKTVAVVDALPRNTMGKVQKQALREQFKDAFGPAH